MERTSIRLATLAIPMRSTNATAALKTRSMRDESARNVPRMGSASYRAERSEKAGAQRGKMRSLMAATSREADS